ncbi:OmpA family protein [Solilutibacter silvestris]|uniref:OmpA family protein n=1 Tax=Solilutibacter silvestris TaxID=1645665 RepID=A0A2K1PY39_9GAMM|nr:OmpA family protein [Lysobacter silvestris]PNS07699.1 OmpA family protein [Lysobacter silvestris]
MFDSILQDVATRYGISLEKAKQLLGMLVAVIFNEKRGGPAGFVDLFRSHGLGDLIASWIGHGPNQAISPAQLESVLGSDTVGHIAQHAGVDAGTASTALSAMLPEVFHTLTEDGQIPVGSAIPERLHGYLGGIGDFMHGIGTGVIGAGAGVIGAGTAAVGAVGAAGGKAVDAIGGLGNRATAAATGGSGSSGSSKWLPWVLLAALVAIGLFLLSRCNKAPEPATSAPAVTTPSDTAKPATAASAQPSLKIDNQDGSVNVGGQLVDADKTRLADALKQTFGADAVKGDISADATTAPAGWLDKVIAVLPDLKAKGVKFAIDGDKVKIDLSGVPEGDRAALSDKIRDAFAGFEISGLYDKGADALSKLKDGFSADDLVKALSLMGIRFDTGKATITKDSLEILTKAADTIKRAPAGTKIEVGGYTDNTGNAAANMKLSQERADAVVAKLKELGVTDGILSGKGYGQDKPVADNGTADGRAKNRRIEFTVAK